MITEPTSKPRPRGRPPRLSREKILEGALELIDAQGYEARTMRGLGSALGVEAMSLYRHVENKEAVIDGLAEVLMAEIPMPKPDGDWQRAARGFANGTRTVARAHPEAFELVALRALCTPAALTPVEQLIAALRAGGFSPAQAVATYRLLASYSRGFALMEISDCTIEDTALERADFPALGWVSERLKAPPSDAAFRAGLDAIIAGLDSADRARARS
ncbi:MAG: TetR/AcrR family transcriptional regulator C-terminal domain-containing protein [Solirubrobacteraceae bacterium]